MKMPRLALTEEDVDAGKNELVLAVGGVGIQDRVARHKVTETYGGIKIYGYKEGPT